MILRIAAIKLKIRGVENCDQKAMGIALRKYKRVKKKDLLLKSNKRRYRSRNRKHNQKRVTNKKLTKDKTY